MSCKLPRTKEEYLQAQELLLDEALEGDLTQIQVYPAQNRELWFLDKAYRTIGLIHRWLFFSDYLKPGVDPCDRVFSIYTFSTLLKKAVFCRGVAHPKRDLIEFVEEALHKMEEAKIIEFVIKDNGHLGVCLHSNSNRTGEIAEGKARYAADRECRQQQRSDQLQLLTRCFALPTSE